MGPQGKIQIATKSLLLREFSSQLPDGAGKNAIRYQPCAQKVAAEKVKTSILFTDRRWLWIFSQRITEKKKERQSGLASVQQHQPQHSVLAQI